MMNALQPSPWSDLSAALDPVRLMLALGAGLEHCASGAWVIDGLRISKVRRSSSVRRDPHPISMCIDLALRDVARGTSAQQRYFAKAYRDGASAQALREIDASGLVAPKLGPAFARLPDLDMLVWQWPNDPALPQLAPLTDPARIGALLPGRLAGAAVSEVEVLRYEPERRATLRCTLAPVRQGEPARTVYAKTFAQAQAQRLMRRFARAQSAASRDVHAACVAEPLAVDAQGSTLWQLPAPGRPLLHDPARPDPEAAFTAIGAALARLHTLDLDEPALRSLDYWLGEVQRRVRKIGRAAPDLALRAAAVGKALEQSAARLPSPTLGLIHGDFHPGQVWLAGERVVFFDFDEFALGHPMEDLAEFIVKLEQLAQPASRFDAQVRALIAGYQQAGPNRFDAGWLQWYRALQTLLQASRAFVYQEPGWPVLLNERLHASEQLVQAIRAEVAA